MVEQPGIAELLLQAVREQQLQGQPCCPKERREVELATLARAGMKDVRNMPAEAVRARMETRARCEGLVCRVRPSGSGGSWQRGLCRRYGVKTFHFVPLDEVKTLPGKRKAAAADSKDRSGFERALEARVGRVLDTSKFDILNEFEWALLRTSARVEQAEQELDRLRSEMRKLDGAYRHLLRKRKGGKV